MANQLLSSSRRWHRKIASLLFIFFFLVSLTGLMLGYKSLFTKTVFDNKAIKPENSVQKRLPLDTLEKLATASLNKLTNKHYKEAESIQLKPSKGLISFAFKDYYSVQVNGATGETMHVDQKLGTWIQDLLDGAIIKRTKKLYEVRSKNLSMLDADMVPSSK